MMLIITKPLQPTDVKRFDKCFLRVHLIVRLIQNDKTRKIDFELENVLYSQGKKITGF